MDDEVTPIFVRGKRNLSCKERLEILYIKVNEGKVCSKHPLCVQANRSVLNNKEDWFITDMGSFRNLGNYSKISGIRSEKVSNIIPLCLHDYS